MSLPLNDLTTIGYYHALKTEAGEVRLVLAWQTSVETFSLRDAGTLRFSASSDESSDPVSLRLERIYPPKISNSFTPRNFHSEITGRPSMDSPEYLSWLSRRYEMVKDQVGSLILSPDMMTLMGYVVEEQRKIYVYDERGTVVEHSSVEYFSTSKCTRVASNERREVEEGEEDECDANNNQVATESNRFPLDICGIDCEMVTTAVGQELGRVSIVSPIHGIVYDTFVKPGIPIVNYNTEFSGITKEKLEGVTTTLKDVQIQLRKILHASTIVVGHSLENDFKTLGLHHTRVIDTAALFPHMKGLPMKLSLKRLAEDILQQSIQSSETDGHNSTEDAFIALELVMMKASGHPDPVLQIPHLFSEFPRVSVWEYLSPSHLETVDVSLFSFKRLNDRPDWERYALGLKPSSDAENSIRVLSHSKCDGLKSHEYRGCYDLIEDAVKTFKVHSNPPLKKFSWIDMPYNTYSVNSSYVWVSLNNVDECLEQAFNQLLPGSMAVIVTQGDLIPLKFLASRKQQYKWDRGRIFWSDDDESRLIMAAANCLAGAAFMKRKS